MRRGPRVAAVGPETAGDHGPTVCGRGERSGLGFVLLCMYCSTAPLYHQVSRLAFGNYHNLLMQALLCVLMNFVLQQADTTAQAGMTPRSRSGSRMTTTGPSPLPPASQPPTCSGKLNNDVLILGVKIGLSRALGPDLPDRYGQRPHYRLDRFRHVSADKPSAILTRVWQVIKPRAVAAVCASSGQLIRDHHQQLRGAGKSRACRLL